MRPTVAFISDFGTRDYYVGAVRGAVLASCPDATVVDITHEVSPHDIEAGAWSLAAAYQAFPPRTVFLAVVDPGVGSERRGIVIEAGGYRFVGPDNGIFSHILARNPDARVHEISNAGLFRHKVSPAFHGRDVFAPVAGQLALGVDLDQVGPPAGDLEMLQLRPPRQIGDAVWEVPIVHVDRFGNLITSMSEEDLQVVLSGVDGDVTGVVAVLDDTIMPLVRAYGQLSAGEPCALIGGSGHLEVAINGGNAAAELGAGRGSAVRLRIVSPGT